jgi:hypothetical protein
VHVQNEIAVPPVSTCSFFTNAESRHPGQTGGCSLCDSRGRRLRAVDIGVLGREPIINAPRDVFGAVRGVPASFKTAWEAIVQ